MTEALRALILAVALLAAGEADALSPKSNRIDIKYGEPKSPEHQPVYKLVRDARALEKLRDLLSPLMLPRLLLLQTRSCDGFSNAWYDGNSVSVCYEYLDEIWQKAPEKTTPSGVAPIDALVGPFFDVFFHEVGHAVFDMLHIPLFGREEDAADQFSTFLMLRFQKDEARRLILGAAYQYKGDLSAPSVTVARQKFADEHGAPLQRFYNLVCMAYGYDKTLFADVVEKGFLPEERAPICEAEYRQAAYAMNNLIGPFIDRKVARKLKRSWLPAATTQPKRYRAP